MPVTARAQDDGAARIRTEQRRLEQLRSEREALERQRTALQGTVHDLSQEVANLDQQTATTERLVRSLDDQLAAISLEVGRTTTDLVRAEDELAAKQAMLRQRLVDIYKRGALFDIQVLLAAESFGDLVSRYKYLHLLAQRDRALVRRVADLRDEIRRQRGNLVRFQTDIELNRGEKAAEEARLRALRAERGQSLVSARRRERQTSQRLSAISRDEQRLTGVIAALEAARRRAERAGPASERSTSTLRTSDLGKLAWPVEGEILYTFGRVVNPNNTTTRWNGIGISAPEGTPVRAVAAGRVVVAEPFGTYGLTVIVQHGGGDYSVYGSLQRLAVSKDATVSKGQVIGYVGSSDPELPPHLHFEIRPQGRAVDPLAWLRAQQ